MQQQNDSASIITALSTVLCSYIMKKYNLDMTLYAALSIIITVFVKYCYNYEYQDYYYYYLGLILFLYLIYAYKNQFMNMFRHKKKEPENKYLVLNLNTEIYMSKFYTYIMYFPEFVEKPRFINCGYTTKNYSGQDLQITTSYETLPMPDTPVKFNDTAFNVSGYFVFKQEKIVVGKDKDGVDKIVDNKYIQLCIESDTCSDSMKYFNDICKVVVEKEKNDCNITLYHIKVVSAGQSSILTYVETNKFIMYYGKQQSLESVEKQYIDTFFHPQKDQLWGLIKTVHFEPEKIYALGQPPQIGLLLFGPPGTGKSSFAYRIAMALNRHIISMDIRALKKRSKVFNLLRTPNIDGDKGQVLNVNKIVYIFDEFDITVTELYNKNKYKQMAVEKWFSEVRNNDKNTDKITPFPQSDEDDLNLSDLLEIFQGPVPMPGAIIIATTNKYEEIKDMCPALFRPGRLTPVHFGNPDNKTIEQISKHYFDRNLSNLRNSDKNINQNTDYVLNTSYSQIMHYVMESKLSNNGFDYFKNKVSCHI